MCNNNIPWAINDTVSFGFAAAHIINKTESDLCCKCYHLTFTSPPVKGKKMVVQVTSSGGSGWNWVRICVLTSIKNYFSSLTGFNRKIVSIFKYLEVVLVNLMMAALRNGTQNLTDGVVSISFF